MKLRELDKTSYNYKVNLLAIYYMDNIAEILDEWLSLDDCNHIEKAIKLAEEVIAARNVHLPKPTTLGILALGIIESISKDKLDKCRGVTTVDKVIDFVEKTLGEETEKSSDIECVIVTEEDGKETGSKAGVANESLGYTSENIERHLQRICEIASCNKRYIKLADNFDTIPSAIKTINDNMLEDLNIIVNVLNYCISPICKNTLDSKSEESIERLYISFIETLREKYKEDIANIISIFSRAEVKFKTSNGNVVVKQKIPILQNF